MLLIHLVIDSDAHSLELLSANWNSFERQPWNMQHFNLKVSLLRNYVLQLGSDWVFCQRLFSTFSMSMISFSIEQILNILFSCSQYYW